MKLTKQLRAATVRRLVDHAAAPGDLALRRREHALAIRIMRGRYGDDVFERCRALPDGWLQSGKQFALAYELRYSLPSVRVEEARGEGRRGTYAHAWPLGYFSLAEYAPVPWSALQPWGREEVGGPLPELHDLFAAAVEHRRALEDLRTRSAALLDGFVTVEALAADWPAAYAHLPQEMLRPAQPNLPAPLVADLDAAVAALRAAA